MWDGEIMSEQCPKQVEGLEIHEVADGYVVYQHDRDRVHYLNKTAALILELCNERNSKQQIGELLQQAFDLPELPEEDFRKTMDSLVNEGLVE
jgi:hypothetical protein